MEAALSWPRDHRRNCPNIRSNTRKTKAPEAVPQPSVPISLDAAGNALVKLITKKMTMMRMMVWCIWGRSVDITTISIFIFITIIMATQREEAALRKASRHGVPVIVDD